MRFVLLSVLLVIGIFAQEDANISTQQNYVLKSDISKVDPVKVLYLKYEELPKRVVKGEIFPITIRTLSTTQDYEQIKYNFSNQSGLETLNSIPYRQESGKYFYDTFYFLVNSKWAKLPDIEAYIEPNPNNKYDKTVLTSQELNVITLNPRNNFSNIVAESFGVVEYKTTSYDNKHNIIVFAADASRCDVSSLKFEHVYKQGVESITESVEDSKITYFVVVDKNLDYFKFSYFNLKQNRFNNITIPIIVDDDRVVTQTDLKPKDQSKERLKLVIAISVALVLVLLILWRRKYIYTIILVFPLAYIAYLSVPSKQLCIKKDSNIYLLPVSNGTVFETTSSVIHLQKEGEVKDFVKVKLTNSKIGWVKNENICSY